MFMTKNILKNNLLIPIIIVLVGALIASFLLFSDKGFSGLLGERSQPVATVNGEKISKDSYSKVYAQFLSGQRLEESSIDEVTKENIKQSVLDVLITQELIRQEGKKIGVNISGQEIENKFNEIKTSFERSEDFYGALEQEKLTEEDLKEIVEMDLLFEAVIKELVDSSKISASNEEIQKMYNDVFTGDDDKPKFSDVSQQIKELLIQQKNQEAVMNFIQNLKDEAKIEILI